MVVIIGVVIRRKLVIGDARVDDDLVVLAVATEDWRGRRGWF